MSNQPGKPLIVHENFFHLLARRFQWVPAFAGMTVPACTQAALPVDEKSAIHATHGANP